MFSAAAMLLLMFMVLFSPVRPIAGVLTDSVNAQWINAEEKPTIGDVLRPGEMMLASGFAEITFAKGAKVVIEAPAKIELIDTNRMFLHEGKLSAQAPPQAFGFTVDTPAASIRDIGTEFGVNVKNSHSEVHVFKGEVKLFEDAPDSGADTEVVTQGQARGIKNDGRGIQTIELDKEAFTRQIPSPYELAVKQSKPVAYWRFEDDAQAIMTNSINKNSYTGQFYGPVEYIEGPQLGGNQPNKALYFDGRSSYAVVDNIHNYNQRTDAYTIMMWVRFNEIKEQYIWATATKGTDSRCIGITNDGRFNHHTDHIDGACAMSDIKANPNIWYHIAVTGRSYGKKIMYVNGRPTGSFDEMWDIGRFRNNLILGRKSLSLESANINDFPPFAGTIDELSWHDKELSPKEVNSFYTSSLPQ